MKESLYNWCIKNNHENLIKEWDYEKNNANSLFIDKISYGSGKIATNASSRYLFCDPKGVDFFAKLTTINNAHLLDTSNTEDFLCMCYMCQLLETLDVSTWDISKASNLQYMFVNCSALKVIDVSNWDTSSITNITGIFWGCSSVTTLDISKWDTHNVTSLYGVFANCQKVKVLDVSNWDTSQVTDMESTFYHCYALTHLDVSKWNTGKVVTMNSLFSQGTYGNESAKFTELDISNWDVSNVTDMGYMFYGTRYLKSLDVSRWNTSKVQTLQSFLAFSGAVLKGIEKWDVSNCEVFALTFFAYPGDTINLTGWDVRKAKTFVRMFDEASIKTVQGLNTWNTSNVYDFIRMFANCRYLEELDLSSFDTRNATSSWDYKGTAQTGGVQLMFINVNTLRKLTLGENFSFKGDGSCTALVLPTPNANYITGADGKWYDFNGDGYTPKEIPDKTRGIYYAAFDLIDGEYLVKRPEMLKLANTVRTTTETEGKMTIGEMREALLNNNAYESGKAKEWSDFWDAYQENGNRQNHSFAFAGRGWSYKNFKPKYDIKPTTASYMFAEWDSSIPAANRDLVKLLNDAGVTLDTSQCTSFSNFLRYGSTATLPVIDTRSCTNLGSTFVNCSIVSIEKIILKDDGSQTIGSMFASNNPGLTTVSFEGKIGTNCNFSTCNKLSHDSLINILNTLQEKTSGTFTCTLGATNLGKLTDTEKAIATNKGWTLA